MIFFEAFIHTLFEVLKYVRDCDWKVLVLYLSFIVSLSVYHSRFPGLQWSYIVLTVCVFALGSGAGTWASICRVGEYSVLW